MTGKTLLHYEIVDKIGKGGMGEVFRARDTKLGRDVAVKILPAELSGDPEREARFQREARALASLQHANVASVYGFEEADGVRFLVMELVPGVELTQRMGKGPVPVAETLNIARQIAAGLEAAHESGIVHRDLKPANIMETPEGEVKILDFGLAQAWFGDSGSTSESTATPTITAAMTQVGAILGTAAYMSPEQARGSNVDRRADIWAFGVILYEMLTGKKLFHGETISDTLAAVLRATPEWDLLPVAEAPQLCRLIERCLERNPKQRLRDIGEARIFLEDGGQSGTSLSFSHLGLEGAGAAPARSGPPVILLAAVAVLFLAVGGFLGLKVLAQKPGLPPVIHAMIPPPEQTDYDLKGGAPGPAAVSPDGSMVAFTARDDQAETRLYLRHLNRGESVSLSGTEGAAYPFWSPDNQFIGFFDESGKKLRKVAVAGGPPVTLCVADNMKGGSWNEQGEIIFAPAAVSTIFKVPAVGGDPVPVTVMESGFSSHRHPRFLPGGREFLFLATPSTSGLLNKVFLASMDTSVAPREIAESQANFDYCQANLLTVKEDVLMTAPFTPDQAKVTAGGTPLVENILIIQGAALGIFSASPSGVLVYQTGGSTNAEQVVYWTDTQSLAQVSLGESGQVSNPVLSPDRTRAMLEVADASNEGVDLWLMELATGLRTRFTFAKGDESRPCWSPDGTMVYYSSVVDGKNLVMEQPVEGQGGAAIILEYERTVFPTSVSPDGKILLLNWEREDSNMEIHMMSLDDPNGETTLLASSDDDLAGGKYSPDGRWIAYHTTSSEGWDVFVIPATGGARKWQVSTEGAVYPLWNHDGTELWVTPFNGAIRAFKVDGTGQTFRVGGFQETGLSSVPDANGSNYDLNSREGRILQIGVDPAFQSEVSYLHLVTDWKRGLVQ